MEDEKELLSNAKIGLLAKGSVFLSTILFSLKQSFSEEVPTAGTDGSNIIFNPKFFKDLSHEERVGLIAHEVWHVAFMHMLRLGDRDPEVWNWAGDFVINLLLREAGFKLPENGLIDDQYKNMSTEQVYDILMENNFSNSAENDLDLIFGSKLSKEEEQALENNMKEILVRATTKSKISGEDSGSIPQELTRIIDDLINPKLPWNILLQRFLNDRAKNDYSWARPNKKFMPEIILPSMYNESLGHIAIAIDTSGSLGKAELTEILSEIDHIHKTFKPEKLTIIGCDYIIHDIYEVESDQNISEFTFKGNGGTAFEPVFKYLKDIPTQALIYFH